MRNFRGHTSGHLASLLSRPRYEVIPTKNIEAAVVDAVPTDVTLTVTVSPTKGLDATLDLTERLAGHGYAVVPHLSARLVRDSAHLTDIVDRLRGLGIRDVFVPAGDADPPAGTYDGALPVLAELTALGTPFPEVGITGYPESHPRIDDDVTIQAMWDKRQHATYIVSNLCFDAKLLSTWLGRVRRRGVGLSVYIGIAGPVERAKLLSMATKIGVGESTRFLAGHATWFLRFAAPGGYSLDRMLSRLGPDLTRPELGVAGLHVFTFNQVAETERWRQASLSRLSAAPPARETEAAG